MLYPHISAEITKEAKAEITSDKEIDLRELNKAMQILGIIFGRSQ